MTTYAYVNEVTRVEYDGDTYFIKRFSILTTPFVIYEAWEMTSRSERQHMSITNDNRFGMLGKVTSRVNPKHIESLTPGSPLRIEACAVLRRAREELCERAIIEAYPFLTGREDVHWRDGKATTSELED